MKKALALILALAMVFALCACGQSAAPAEQPAPAAEEAAPAEDAAPAVEETAVVADPFYVWAWNTDFVTILEQVLPQYLTEDELARVQFVNVGDSSIYQEKIDAILADPTNEQYPDIMLLEVGYVQKYVQSGLLKNVKDLGITDADMANMYDYNLSLGTDAASGDTYALF